MMKKKMKKKNYILAIAAIAVLMMGVTACGAVDNDASDSNDITTTTADSSERNSDSNETDTVEKAEESGNVMGTDLCGDLSKKKIGSITFLNTLDDMPDDAWDVSENQDGSVMAWSELPEDSQYYDLFIAGEGGVDAPECADKLFYNYSLMVEVDFNSCLYTGKTTSMDGIFQNCSNVICWDLRSWDTSNVTDMARMFYYNRDLTEIKFDGFDTSSVTSMVAMFYECSSLQELDLSDWNTSNVTHMTGMFQNCSSLQTLNVSTWDTSSVGTGNTSVYTGIERMFLDCSALESLDLSNWDISNITDMSCMFMGCSSLTDLDISGWDMSGVTDTSNMYSGTIWE